MKRYILLFTLVALLAMSCSEDESSSTAVSIQTFPAEVLDGGGLKLNGAIGLRAIDDHGFIIFHDESSYAVKNISLGVPKNIGAFSIDLTSGLEEGVSYRFAAFIERNGKVSYGSEHPFVWTGDRPPKILDYYPKKGHMGDTVTILGSDFGPYPSVRFNTSITAEIITRTDTLISVIVPGLEAMSASITLSQSTLTTSLPVGTFNLETPEIISFEPINVGFREIITVYGEHFDTNSTRNEVKIGGKAANIISSTRTSITVVLPDEIETSYPTITVKSQLQVVESATSIEVNGPKIEATPTSGYSRDMVTITGANFHPDYYRNKVYFGEAEAKVQFGSSRTYLTVMVPEGPYPNKRSKISISVLDKEAISDEEFEIQDTWRVLSKSIPLNFYGAPGAFALGNKGYVICNSQNFTDEAFYNWEYDPTSNEWTRYDLPFEMNFGGDALGNGTHGYVYTGTESNNFWRFDAYTKQWEQLADFIGPHRGAAAAFSLLGRIYIGLGGEVTDERFPDDLVDFYYYDPATDKWSRISDVPFSIWGGQERFNMTGFEIGGYAYLVGGAGNTGDSDYWRYDPVNDEWTEMGNFVVINNNVAFVLNGKGYVATGDWNGYNYCWEYDADNNEWAQIENVGNSARHRSFSFVIDNKAYIGGGYSNYNDDANDELLIWDRD